MFFIGMKITIPVTTSAKVAEGNPQMTFTESQTKEKAFDREKMTDNQTGLSMSASLNRMSALLQQFWNTPMYSEAFGYLLPLPSPHHQHHLPRRILLAHQL